MMDEEGWRSLELKLISCRDLKAFNFFQKLSVYAVVSIVSDEDQQKQSCSLRRHKTLVDGEGGGNPEWNHVMRFDLNPNESLPDKLLLKFKLRCGGVVFGKRSIGEVRVPLKDLMEEFNGSVRFLSYQVRSSDGKPNGVLNFSYELKGNSKAKKKEDEPASSSSSSSNYKSSLYPSLDDIRSPLPAAAPAFYYQLPSPSPLFGVAHGIYHPCPSPLVQHPRPLWYTTETLAYGYNTRGSYPFSWQ